MFQPQILTRLIDNHMELCRRLQGALFFKMSTDDTVACKKCVLLGLISSGMDIAIWRSAAVPTTVL